MDEKFYELLGNMFMSAAKSRRQLDNFIQMSQQGFKGFEEMSELFRKFYGLDKFNFKEMEKDSSGFIQPWQNAVDEFQKSCKEFMNMMGTVPREDYIRLVKKYEEMKKRVADQEETIRHLQILLGEKSADQGESAKVLQDLMTRQSEQFMEMMETVGGYFKKETKGDN